MGFGGHVLDMMNRSNYNRSLQISAKNKFKNQKARTFKNSSDLVFNAEKFSKLSIEETRDLNLDTLTTIKRENQFKYSIVLVILLASVFFFLISIN